MRTTLNRSGQGPASLICHENTATGMCHSAQSKPVSSSLVQWRLLSNHDMGSLRGAVNWTFEILLASFLTSRLTVTDFQAALTCCSGLTHTHGDCSSLFHSRPPNFLSSLPWVFMASFLELISSQVSHGLKNIPSYHCPQECQHDTYGLSLILAAPLVPSCPLPHSPWEWVALVYPVTLQASSLALLSIHAHLLSSGSSAFSMASSRILQGEFLFPSLISPSGGPWLQHKPLHVGCTDVLEFFSRPFQAEVLLVKAVVFPVVMFGCESWTIKKARYRRIDAFEPWCWRRLLRVPWTSRRSNQSILKEISPEYSLEGLMRSWNSNTLATWYEELTR